MAFFNNVMGRLGSTLGRAGKFYESTAARRASIRAGAQAFGSAFHGSVGASGAIYSPYLRSSVLGAGRKLGMRGAAVSASRWMGKNPAAVGYGVIGAATAIGVGGGYLAAPRGHKAWGIAGGPVGGLAARAIYGNRGY